MVKWDWISDVGAVGSAFRGEVVLNLRTDEGNDFVAKKSDGNVNAAFTAAVQPDDEGVLYAVSFQGPGLVGSIGEGFVTGLTGRAAREGAFIEIVGFRDKVCEGFGGLALDGGELLLAYLEDFAFLEFYLNSIVFFPDVSGFGKAQATAFCLVQAKSQVFTFGVEGAAGVGGVDREDRALRSVGIHGKDRRVYADEFDFRLYNNKVHGR